MVGRLAGFFLIVAGALVAVGAFPTWVTVAGGNSTGFSAFTAVGDNRDAIVSFSIAGALLLLGFAMSVRPQIWSRILACVAGVAAVLWAGLLFFALAPQTRDLLGPASNVPASTTGVGLGLWITAAGGVLGLIGGMIALAARRPRVVAPATSAVPVYPPAAPMPRAPYPPVAPVGRNVPAPRTAPAQASTAPAGGATPPASAPARDPAQAPAGATAAGATRSGTPQPR